MWPMKTFPAPAGKSSPVLGSIRNVGGRRSEKVGGWREWMADQWSQSIVAPGLDLVYEGMRRYGASLTLFGSLVLFAWMLWTMDYRLLGK